MADDLTVSASFEAAVGAGITCHRRGVQVAYLPAGDEEHLFHNQGLGPCPEVPCRLPQIRHPRNSVIGSGEGRIAAADAEVVVDIAAYDHEVAWDHEVAFGQVWGRNLAAEDRADAIVDLHDLDIEEDLSSDLVTAPEAASAASAAASAVDLDLQSHFPRIVWKRRE